MTKSSTSKASWLSCPALACWPKAECWRAYLVGLRVLTEVPKDVLLNSTLGPRLILRPILTMAARASSFSRPLRQRLTRLSQFVLGAPIVGFSALYLWTSRCRFEPFGPENSTLFQHPILKIINPRNKPYSHDCCVRAVPFAQVRPELLEDARRGGTHMIEAFCAGMWG
jgi:hypothetical protein